MKPLPNSRAAAPLKDGRGIFAGSSKSTLATGPRRTLMSS